VRAKFHPVGLANLSGNPDFPVLILENGAGEHPQAMLLGVDARNGKDSWSLASDPIILIILFADHRDILAVYVDTGFADQGRASGTYTALDDPASLALFDLLKSLSTIPSRTYL
jgi:hypothetical protein